MKKTIALVLTLLMIFGVGMPIYAEGEQKSEAEKSESAEQPFTVDARSAVLMEAETGKILFSQNENAAYSPASVTKIMTLLLTMEALDGGKFDLATMVPVSAYAASMGGSQVFLEEGESLSVEDMLKCTVIASANDAAVALAEFVSGSEEGFVADMNRRAAELGMKDSHFENATGLDDTTENHVTSAMDIALMSRALLSHPKITEYASIWQDTIRDGEFTLTNTNRLVRFYSGCNGLKTGSTDRAGFCMSAAAKRDGMQLIAVVMGAQTRDERNAIAKKLLDYGFSKYSLYETPEEFLEYLPVTGGKASRTALVAKPFTALVGRGEAAGVEKRYSIPESVAAPVRAGQAVGKIEFYSGEKKIGECEVCAKDGVDRIDFAEVVFRLIGVILGKNAE